MKRIIICLLSLTLLLFTLTSCQVNWFGDTLEVEWWVIAIPVAIIAVMTLFIGKITLSDKNYICPECKKSFRPGWIKALFTVHFNSDKVLKCPHCGRKGFCKVDKEQ